MIHEENYDKLHAYLLDHSQQELAGHLDTLWQELMSARKTLGEKPVLIEAEATPETDDTDDTDGATGWGYKKK